MTTLQSKVTPEMIEARKAWWNETCRQGDPIRRPNLSYEAFAAGWDAAMQSTQPEAPLMVTDEVRKALEVGLEWAIDGANECKTKDVFHNAMRDVARIEAALAALNTSNRT